MYFVPLPEEDMFAAMYDIQNTVVSGYIDTIITISVPIEATVIYYQHWEDNCSATEIWGDGNATNGCSPLVTSLCLDSDDRLMGGSIIRLSNEVVVNPSQQDPDTLHFDAGDKIQSSYPVVISRSAFPESPGPLIGGAVEVREISDSSGTAFQMPIGTDTSTETNALQMVRAFVSATEDDTVIEFPSGTSELSSGETLVIDSVLKGDAITSNKPIQVFLITGDLNSNYEMRWYALLPFDQWSREYIAPVGSYRVGILLYNPGESNITVSSSLSDGSATTVVGSKDSTVVQMEDDVGARFWSSDPFAALLLVDNLLLTEPGTTF
jgi:hypothetical protein